MASAWTWQRAICSAVAAGAAGQQRPAARRAQAPTTAHSSARMPPIEPPITAKNRSMPSSSARRRSTATWSRMVIVGKRLPHGRPVGSDRGGAGRALAAAEHVGATTKKRSVSMARPGPTSPSHQPGVGWPVAGGAGDVAVAGQGVEDQDGVRHGARVELAPGLVGDRHRPIGPPMVPPASRAQAPSASRVGEAATPPADRRGATRRWPALAG